MSLEFRIVVVATEEDRALLNLLMELDGSASMSATVRRLIRQEAKRMDVLDPQPQILPTIDGDDLVAVAPI